MEASTPAEGEPVLTAGTAEVLLRMTGRAVEAGGRLSQAHNKMDSIGRAALAIHEGKVRGTLSQAIEEVTGKPSTLHPAVLAELVTQSALQHSVELGVSEDEAAAQTSV